MRNTTSLMSAHAFVPDKAVSIAHGIPLGDEPGLGDLTLSGFIREVTERYAEREALVRYDENGARIAWSYADLWARSRDVAKALTASGLGKGERVGVLMTNREEFLASVFGAALAGGVAVPLSTFSTPSELGYLVASSCCSVLLLERSVLQKDFAQTLCELDPAIASATPGAIASLTFPYLRYAAMLGAEHLGAIENWDAFIARGAGIATDLIDARAASVTPSDPGVLFFSSGSTNKPKGILSAHRGVSIQLWRAGRQQGLGDGVRAWTPNGFFWSGNFAMVVGGALSMGGALVLQRIFQAETALTLMAAEKVSFLFAWPHQWAQLEGAANWRDADLSALKYIDADSVIARHPSVNSTWHEPRHCYGNTETFTLSTGYPANTTRDVAGDSHGLPFPGMSIKIVDPLTGHIVPIGARGEIAVKGPTLMLGYLGIPLDQTLDENGYFRTGDGGFLDEAGRLFWGGRLNDIIKTGGANVSPAEIDEVIRDFPGVKVTQTVGVPHDTLGEIVIACIVPHDGAALDEDRVRAFAREKLASYKTPRRVLFFAEADLQLTGTNKIKTADLRTLVEKRLSADANRGN